MTGKPFYQTEKGLWKAKGYYSPNTGEAITLTLAEKAVYMYIEDRVGFFVHAMKGEYFETHETIAEAVGIERKACGNIIRKFIENGVVCAVKRKPKTAGQLQWFYTNVDKSLKFWNGSEKEPKPITGVLTKQDIKKPFVNVYGDEEGSPF